VTKQIEQHPPVLALFRSGPLAVLRIHDMAYSDVVPSLVKHLPADVLNLMLVTPTDTKMFDIEGRMQHAPSLPDAHEPEQEDVQEEFIRSVAPEEVPDESEREQAEAELQSAETPADRRKALNKIRRTEQAGNTSTCGRCRGAGVVPVAMPDGGASNAACPLCQGKGSIQRYGVRR